ncbi:MAG TPA: hypothetical protein VFB14_23280 [Bryobacteraceae bacterium]|nr:hypothetical protein [Bryobacteraceae bacterium]
MAIKPFYAIGDHILLPWADSIAQVDGELRAKLTDEVLKRIVGAVPPGWLPEADGPNAQGYLMYFKERLAKSKFAEEAAHARAQLV